MDPFGGYGGFSDFAGSGTIWYDSAGNVISSPFGSSGMGSSGFTNPVAILGTVIIVIGVVMLIAGIILAVYLKSAGIRSKILFRVEHTPRPQERPSLC